jgi:acetylornithine/succinyldiaminopimelate/putrescine aminotransferase
MGRTGSLFAYEQTAVVPDVVTLAKALGGGLPIGAMLAAEHCAGALRPGYHGSTFGGNPVACAAAGAALSVIADPAVAENGRAIAELLRELLAPLGELSGRGLMIGLNPHQETDAPAVVKRLLMEHRVVANATGPNNLRLLPPLTLTEDQARDGASAIISALEIS